MDDIRKLTEAEIENLETEQSADCAVEIDGTWYYADMDWDMDGEPSPHVLCDEDLEYIPV